MKESKQDRFVRIAEARTNKILQTLRLIGNLANRATYDYTPEDVEKIFGAIEIEIEKQKERFSESIEGKRKGWRFSFSDPMTPSEPME